MSEHTKTPWAIHDSGFIYSVPDSDHDEFHAVVCETEASECPDGMFVSIDDARHIVKAVNNHERLVEALEEAATQLEIVYYHGGNEFVAQRAREARTILKELEGEL